MGADQRERDPPQESGRAGAGRPPDGNPRAPSERHRVEAVRRGQPLAGEDGREIVEVRALGRRIGRLAVDRLDVYERRVALGPARGTDRPGEHVSGAQLAAADLGRRHVNVVARVRERVRPHEPAAVRQDVEHAGAHVLLFLLGLRFGRGLLLPAPGGLGLLLGLGFLGLGLLVGFLHRGLSLGFTLARRPLATLGREERLDQLLPPKAAKPLDPELRRDRVEIGERALL